MRRWLRLPVFLAAYREARRETMEKTMAQIQQASWAASTTLIKLLGAERPSRLACAQQRDLNQANKGLETLDHEERLAALEAVAELRGNR